MSTFEQRTPTAAEVKEIARDSGIDLVGIAPIERFDGVGAEADPRSVMGHTRSVIALGHRIPRGSLRGAQTGKAFRGLSMNSPFNYALTRTYRLCCRLESTGWEALPLYPHSRDERNQGVPVAEGRPAPNVVLDVEFAAHAAGLGHLGRGGLFLTPEFGPRQFFTFVATDLELDPDPPLSQEAVCDNCGACARACPAGALSTEALQKLALCEGEAALYGLRLEHCRVCPMTANLSTPYGTGKEPWRLAAACALACVEHLEDEGKLTRSFHNRFRRTPNEEPPTC